MELSLSPSNYFFVLYSQAVQEFAYSSSVILSHAWTTQLATCWKVGDIGAPVILFTREVSSHTSYTSQRKNLNILLVTLSRRCPRGVGTSFIITHLSIFLRSGWNVLNALQPAALWPLKSSHSKIICLSNSSAFITPAWGIKTFFLYRTARSSSEFDLLETVM